MLPSRSRKDLTRESAQLAGTPIGDCNAARLTESWGTTSRPCFWLPRLNAELEHAVPSLRTGRWATVIHNDEEPSKGFGKLSTLIWIAIILTSG